MEDSIKSINQILYLLSLKSRLHALALLGGNTFYFKLAHAEWAFNSIFLASTIENYTYRTFNIPPKTLSWGNQLDAVAECFKDEKSLNYDELLAYIKRVESDIVLNLNNLKNVDRSHLMFASVHFITDLIQQQIGDFESISSESLVGEMSWGTNVPSKTLQTPDIIRLDDHFIADQSVMEKRQVKFSEDSFEQNVEFFWNLSIREILAAEICAMSMFEYDNLPLDFYYDMTKQMWDEARHANFYLQKSIVLLSVAKERSTDERLLSIIEQFEIGGRLPVPKEKNFIEAFVNASLTERLVLLNVRTEAPAVARLKEKMNSPFCEEFPDIKESFSIDRNDEISHGSIGYKWLRFLYPNVDERKEMLQNVDSYRGLLLTTSIEANSDEEFHEILEQLIA